MHFENVLVLFSLILMDYFFVSEKFTVVQRVILYKIIEHDFLFDNLGNKRLLKLLKNI